MAADRGRKLTCRCACCATTVELDTDKFLGADVSEREVRDFVPPISCPKCGQEDSLELEGIEVDEEYELPEEDPDNQLAEESPPSPAPTSESPGAVRGHYLGLVVKDGLADAVIRVAGGSVVSLHGKAKTLQAIFGRRRLGTPITIRDVSEPRKTIIEFEPDVLDAEAGKNN